MKKLLINLFLFSWVSFTFAQTGSIQGVVYSKVEGKPMPWVNVFVKYGDDLIGASTDETGHFVLKPLNPGFYNLTASFIGYADVMRTGIVVKPDKIFFVDSIFMSPGIDMDDIIIEEERVKLVDIEEPGKMTMLAADLENIPGIENLHNALKVVAPEVQVDEQTNDVIVRGSRPGSSIFYIDGVKREGMENGVPSGAVGSMTVYTGGIPAKFGDTTGGVIIIETKSYFDLLNAWKGRQAQGKEL